MQTRSNLIASTAIIYPNVELGPHVIIEDFCIIGIPFKDYQGEKTIIGEGAHIRSHTTIYAGNIIGKNFQTGHKASLRELNTIGNDVSIGTHSIVEHHVLIEDGVRIHSQAFIPEFCILRKHCWIGPCVTLTNAKYPQSPNVKNELKGCVIEEHAKIGANTTILPGITIGANSLVGAGSVVTKNIKAHWASAGNPAKEIREIFY